MGLTLLSGKPMYWDRHVMSQISYFLKPWASLMAQMVKNPLSMWETWIQSLGGKDLLEEGMATHSSILAWKNPMDRGAWYATVHGVAKRRTRLSNFT